MGILNLTPDSFSDGGKYFNNPKSALQRVAEMISEGAKIIDIGGYSTRPCAVDISTDEEISRIYEVVKMVLNEYQDVIISIDTFRATVAKEMLELGAHIINDIGGGTLDRDMYNTVAQYDAPYILMHIKGTPKTMQQNPVYQDVTKDVWDYFIEKIPLAQNAGIKDIIMDVGFGFGKTLTHNYSLFRELDKYALLGLPMMVGISRKSMVTKLLNIDKKEALPFTTTLHFNALQNNVNILRTHDVKETVKVIELFCYLQDGNL